MNRKKIIKNTSLNDKGFTFIEIIAVVIIIAILLLVVGVPVSKYVLNSKSKTYESYKKDLAVASENLLVQCMANNEEDCIIPSYGNDLKIPYSELVEKGYSKKLKDPEGDGYCDASYVVATNKSQTGVDIDYKVCLFCDNYKTKEEGCIEVHSNDTTPPTCGDVTGESEVWTKDNKVITVGCTDDDSGCTNSTFSRSLGTDNEVITNGNITIKDNAGNKTNCPVKVYVDRKAPTCKIEIDQTSSNGWYKKGIVAKLVDVQDEGSGVSEKGMGTSLTNRTYNEKTSYEVTGGIVTVFGYAKDKVGNEGYCSKEVKVDNTKPIANLYMGYEIYPKENIKIENNRLTISNLNRYTDIEGFIIYFSEKISRNISSSVYSDEKNIKQSGGVTEGNSKAIIKFEKGTYNNLILELSDASYFSKIIKIEVIKNENETSIWTNKDVSIYVAATDTVTGVDTYSYDGGNTYITDNIKTFSENTSGNIKVKDKVGNISQTYSFNINKIDKTVPSLTVTGYKCTDSSCNSKSGALPNVWINTGGRFDYVATDENFSRVEFQYNRSGSYDKKTDIFNTSKFNSASGYDYFSEEGWRYGKFIAYDEAGNSKEVEVEVKIDKTSPTLTVTGYKCTDSSCNSKSGALPNVWINTGGRFDYVATDENFSRVEFQYNRSGSYDKKTDIFNTSKFNSASGYDYFSEEGWRYGKFIAYDEAGNSKEVEVEVKIDKTAPSAPTVALVDGTWNEKQNDTWYNVTIYVSGSTQSNNPNPSSTDDGSGIAKYQISKDNISWVDWAYNWQNDYYAINTDGINYRYVRAIDNAGNISLVTTKTIKIKSVSVSVVSDFTLCPSDHSEKTDCTKIDRVVVSNNRYEDGKFKFNWQPIMNSGAASNSNNITYTTSAACSARKFCIAKENDDTCVSDSIEAYNIKGSTWISSYATAKSAEIPLSIDNLDAGNYRLIAYWSGSNCTAQGSRGYFSTYFTFTAPKSNKTMFTITR